MEDPRRVPITRPPFDFGWTSKQLVKRRGEAAVQWLVQQLVHPQQRLVQWMVQCAEAVPRCVPRVFGEAVAIRVAQSLASSFVARTEEPVAHCEPDSDGGCPDERFAYERSGRGEADAVIRRVVEPAAVAVVEHQPPIDDVGGDATACTGGTDCEPSMSVVHCVMMPGTESATLESAAPSAVRSTERKRAPRPAVGDGSGAGNAER